MNWKRLAVVAVAPIAVLVILYFLNPKDFGVSPWFIFLCAAGGLPFAIYPAVLVPSLFRQGNLSVTRPNLLLWKGVSFVIGGLFWFFASFLLLTQYPELLGLSIAGNVLLAFWPAVFLAAIGLTFIRQRISMWYFD